MLAAPAGDQLEFFHYRRLSIRLVLSSCISTLHHLSEPTISLLLCRFGLLGLSLHSGSVYTPHLIQHTVYNVSGNDPLG